MKLHSQGQVDSMAYSSLLGLGAVHMGSTWANLMNTLPSHPPLFWVLIFDLVRI